VDRVAESLPVLRADGAAYNGWMINLLNNAIDAWKLWYHHRTTKLTELPRACGAALS